jgi:ankyrin repeat protein
MNTNAFTDTKQAISQPSQATNSSQVSSAALNVETFLYMCSFGKPEDVEDAIRDGADVNAPDGKGITPLMSAAWSNNLDVIPVLIKHGSKMDAADNSGRTALTMPIFSWKSTPDINDRTEKTITTLIEHGIDINMPNEDGATPLMLAAMYSESRIVDILLGAGADIDAKDKKGGNAYHYAQKNDDVRNSGTYKKLARANFSKWIFWG